MLNVVYMRALDDDIKRRYFKRNNVECHYI